MSPTLYYKFTGFAKGWSKFVNPIDITKIIDIQYRERLFCINDIEYKYTLKIEYFDPISSKVSISPVIVFGIYGIATNSHDETHIMTLRYKTEQEVINIIKEIKMKQNLISQFDNEQNKKLQEFVDKNLKFKNP